MNYSGMSRPGSITEGLQPQPILTPLSLAPKPLTPHHGQRGPPGDTWTQQYTLPSKNLDKQLYEAEGESYGDMPTLLPSGLGTPAGRDLDHPCKTLPAGAWGV